MFSNTKSIIPTCQEVIELHSIPWSGPFQNRDIDTIEQCFSVINSINGKEKLLLEYMLSMALNGRAIFVSQNYLARRFGCTREWVNKLLRRLVDRGLLYRVSREYSTSIYFVAFAMLQNEFIRRAKGMFLCAQLAWLRRLLASTIFATMLCAAPSDPDLYREFTLRNSKNYFLKSVSVYKCRSECSSVEDERAKHSFSKKKVSMKLNNEHIFTAYESRGVTFSMGAKIELEAFEGDVIRHSLNTALKLSRVSFPYIISSCNYKYKDANRKPDNSRLNALRSFYGPESSTKTITYDSASDNTAQPTSKGNVPGSGTLSNNNPDANGWVYGTAPNGKPTRTREYDDDYRKFSKTHLREAPIRYAFPGLNTETPHDIKRVMAEYVISPEYALHCELWGTEHVSTQVKRWIALAKFLDNPPENATIDPNGEYSYVNQMLANIILNINGPRKNP